MKKGILAVTVALAVFFLFGTCASAAEAQELVEEFNGTVPEGIDVSADMEGGAGQYIGVEWLLSELLSAFGSEKGRVASFFLLSFALAVIVSMCERPLAGLDVSVERTTSCAVLTLASVSIFSALYTLADAVREALVGVVDFLSGAMPVLTAINTASGSVGTASTQALNMSLLLTLIERGCVGVLLPIALGAFTLSFVGALGGEGSGIGGIVRGIRNTFSWGIGIISTVRAAIISIQSVVASAHDSALLRAARYAASGTIPIVGTTVASALGTLGGGLAVARGAVGTAAVGVTVAICLSPLLCLLLYRAALSICISFLEFTSSVGGVRCFSSFRASLDALIATFAASSLICIVQLVVFINGGASVT